VLATADLDPESTSLTPTGRAGNGAAQGSTSGDGRQGSHGDGGGQLPRRQDLDPSTIDLAVPDILHANDHRLQAAQQTVLHPWASESYPPMRYRRCPLIFALGVIDAVV
jgi:hypothetical protein